MRKVRRIISYPIIRIKETLKNKIEAYKIRKRERVLMLEAINSLSTSMKESNDQVTIQQSIKELKSQRKALNKIISDLEELS